jgi:hypothetical protein
LLDKKLAKMGEYLYGKPVDRGGIPF